VRARRWARDKRAAAAIQARIRGRRARRAKADDERRQAAAAEVSRDHAAVRVQAAARGRAARYDAAARRLAAARGARDLARARSERALAAAALAAAQAAAAQAAADRRAAALALGLPQLDTGGKSTSSLVEGKAKAKAKKGPRRDVRSGAGRRSGPVSLPAVEVKARTERVMAPLPMGAPELFYQNVSNQGTRGAAPPARGKRR